MYCLYPFQLDRNICKKSSETIYQNSYYPRALLSLESSSLSLLNDLERQYVPTNGAAILSQNEYAAVSRLTEEKKLLEFICEKLQRVVSGRVVARSEHDPWLEIQKSANQAKAKCFDLESGFFEGESRQLPWFYSWNSST